MPATSSLPLSLSPFHPSLCILLTGSWDRSDSRSPAGSLGSESGLLGPFLLPTRLLGPALPSSVLSAAGSHGRVGAGTVPCNPYPRRGPPPASCPSVLSTMPPLSDLCQTPHLASL